MVFNVPGSDERKLQKGALYCVEPHYHFYELQIRGLTCRFCAALGLDLDVMVLDFEDGVALNQKTKARQLVAETLHKADFGRTEKTVRINSIKAGEDLYVLAAEKCISCFVCKIILFGLLRPPFYL